MLLSLLFTVVILGLIAWGIQALPIPAPFKTVAYIILVVILIVVLAQAFGVTPLGLGRT